MDFQSIVELLQTSKAAGQVLLGTTAIVSAFFTETLTNKNSPETNGKGEDLTEGKRQNAFFSFIFLSLTCLAVFILLLIVVLLMIYYVFHVVPQGENIFVLLKRIAKYYGWSIIVPFVASMLAGITMRAVKKGHWKVPFCILMLLAVIVSGLEFFVEAFRVVQRPTLPLPVEAVSFIVNSRLRAYPFALSGEELKAIGDGSELLAEETNNSSPSSGFSGGDTSGADIPEVVYEEPNSFRGYIDAILNGTYAPGMGKEDYLHKAYEYYEAGWYTDADYCHVGIMWKWINDNYYSFLYIGVTYEECLDKSIEAYQKYEQLFGESAGLHSNMAITYFKKGDREEVRRHIVRAIEISATESYTLPYYKYWIYRWVNDESNELLMEDAQTVLNYEDDLSMYILYGACAVAENKNLPQAYELLCAADYHYNGKSAIVKILRCICADLMGQDESQLLSEIYALEQRSGLTSAEEMYLIRYLFTTNRYEELWGYITQTGNDSVSSLDADLAAMKSSWYFKNQSSSYYVPEDAEQLLNWVEMRLSELSVESEERDMLLLSRMLLQSCLGLIEDTELEIDTPDGPSDLEYALMAVRLFNAGKYPEALRACEMFFQMDAEETESSESGTNSLIQLEPQEQVSLRYYVQLVFAYSNFEYANSFDVNTEMWTAYMEAAERECEAFRQSSKSLSYIGEQFKMLQISIEEAQGRVPEES